MRIAVDAMGGDFAPQEIVKGALLASRESPVEIILVGQEGLINQELKKYQRKGNISVRPASEIIEMNESPAFAVKQKKDSSINVAVSLVAEQRADALVSAGNTGALMAAALFKLGRIKNIERPAIATEFPTPSGSVLLLDMGANVDSKPRHLVQFAQMGSLYAEHVLHIPNPKVGLLNIGEEAEKGNELTQQAYPLLKQTAINFIGNVEGKEIFKGKVDVIVCDGFIGNLILKFAETIGITVFELFRSEMKKSFWSRTLGVLLYPSLRNLRKIVSYDEYGAAPLLGVAGICFKAHGRAKARAIKNAIRETIEAVKADLVGCISKV